LLGASVHDLRSPEWRLLQSEASRVVDSVDEHGLDHLTDDDKVYFLVWIADGEVNNGGMHAVCYNSTGNFLHLFPNAFLAIGAPKKAELFVRLSGAFGPGGRPRDQPTRYQVHCELPEEAVLSIDALDDEYYAIGEDLRELLYRWCCKGGTSGADA
jgi:hypothetical protein